MSWHERFLGLDDSRVQEAVQAFRARLEDLQAKLRDAEAELVELNAQAPAKEAAYEESLLGDDPAAAKVALIEFWESISDCEKKIATIQATLNRERSSPEIEKLALDLWDMAQGFRTALAELYPDALAELSEAQEVYLEVVQKVGGLGVRIMRLESIMNEAAGPFLAEKKYQTATPVPPVLLDPQAVMAAYDPNYALISGINPAALERPQANAVSALAVLKEEV